MKRNALQHPSVAAALRRAARRAVVLLLPAAMLAACIDDDDACPPPVPGDAPRMLSLQLSVPVAAATRADGDGLEVGSDAENFVDFAGRDYKVMIFDADGNYLEDFVPAASFAWQEAPDAAEGGNRHTDRYYTTTLIGPLRNAAPTIRVMVLANWMGDGATWGEGTAYPYVDDARRSDEPTTLDGFFRNATLYNFTMPVEAEGAAATAWQPSYDHATQRGTGIPMFGLSDRIYITRPEAGDVFPEGYPDKDTYVLRSHIYLLRALAKIEVCDEIEGLALSDGGKTEVTGVTLSAFAQAGRFLPDLTDGKNLSWYVEATQVTVPSLPASPGPTVGDLSFVNVAPEGERARFVAYVPEMAFGAEAPRPTLTVTLTSTMAGGTPVTATYPGVEFADYEDGAATTSAYDYLLRNHVYRFRILWGASGLQIRYGICPWDEEELDIPPFD